MTWVQPTPAEAKALAECSAIGVWSPHGWAIVPLDAFPPALAAYTHQEERAEARKTQRLQNRLRRP